MELPPSYPTSSRRWKAPPPPLPPPPPIRSGWRAPTGRPRRMGSSAGQKRSSSWCSRLIFIYLYFYFFFLIISELLKALSACTVLLYLSSCTGHTCVSHKASFFCFLLGWCLSLSSSESTYLRTPGDKLSAIEESESASIYMLHTCVCIALCTYTVGTTKDWIQCAH